MVGVTGRVSYTVVPPGVVVPEEPPFSGPFPAGLFPLELTVSPFVRPSVPLGSLFGRPLLPPGEVG